MSETDFSSANILSRVLSSLSPTQIKESSDILTAWREVLMSVRGRQIDDTKAPDYGSQLFDHSRIIDLKDETLIVETDHPGRIQMFLLHKRYILKGLQMKIPGIPVKNIIFKLKNAQEKSGALRAPTREEMDRAIIRQNSVQNAHSEPAPAPAPESGEKTQLAPELQNIFDQMRSVLAEEH